MYQTFNLGRRFRLPQGELNNWSSGRCGHCAGLKNQRNGIVTRLLRKKYIDSIVLIYKSKNYMSLVHRIHLVTDAENNTTCS